ncbi:unnamed protein product [Rotaria sp. Silwood1]|nr:unnamed protein product [Rotaria sp. Silwood1]CAF1262210.1 unnamed protein product [Rotaria sp. Silwood1]CAF1613957.1 unnamed protein product [Rotaria sp. Silwood1]CAF1614697.1 unnamed protein product [Rotaria sp. Silwood1]CAF5037725.1 unnamed protein product [Rotaria sp. Silwood1]
MSSTNTQRHLICPITLELFNDPVTGEDGNTYEREAITQWIIQCGTSPITKKPLNINRLTPNCAVKDAVETFKQQNVQQSANINDDNG